MRPILLFFPLVLRAVAALLLLQAAAAWAGGQNPDGIDKALEGLPPEVRRDVRLVPERPPLPPVDAADPLALAVLLALQISGDSETRDRHLYQCGSQALAQGRLATARELAARIADHRAGLLLLDLAEAEDNPARAREWLDLATGLPALVKPRQAEQLLARLIFVGRLLGRDETVTAAWWQALRDPLMRFTTTAALLAQDSAAGGVFDLPRLRAAAQDPAVRGRPAPGLHDTARRLFRQALDRLASSDLQQQSLADGLVHAAFEVLTLSRVAHAELLVEFAATFYEAGHEAQSRRLFSRAEELLGAPHEAQARLLYHFARLWRLRGRAADLEPLLAQAEAHVRGMEAMHHPFALAWLAAAQAQAGRDETAQALLVEAARACVENPNRRTALTGAIEICLCQARTGQTLPPGVFERMAALAGSAAAAK
jgi:hypothetical protein